MCHPVAGSLITSLSARRAWIEIPDRPGPKGRDRVALRKESVDRNMSEDVSYSIIVKSLSARRAWIEIKSELQPLIASVTSLSARRAWIEINIIYLPFFHRAVALRKESVDRNYIIKIT